MFRTALSFYCGTVGIFENAWHNDEGGVWFSDVCGLRDTTKLGSFPHEVLGEL